MRCASAKMSLPSGLLSLKENELVRELMAPKRQQSLSTSVARLYLAGGAAGGGSHQWAPVVTGVICFVKDFNRRSYYIIVSIRSIM